MAKSKNLLLTEATTMRMMGLAGIGSLANPFLRENYGEQDPMMNEMGYEYDELEEGDDGGEDFGDEEETYMDENYNLSEDDEYEPKGSEEGGDDEEEGEECEKCGEVHEGLCKGYMQENINKSMKRLKKLLEQAEAEPPPAEEAPAEEPPAIEGGDDAMEDKIKEFVKKLGELVQETLGVQVTVEEESEEPEMPPAPEGGAGLPPPPPAPMAEAINRLVNKVARRVKARLMEAKKKDEKKKTKLKKDSEDLEDLEALEKHYGEEMRSGIKGKHSHKSRMKDIEAAKANLKEKQMAAKKKEMMMKKKKAAMAKKK